MPEPGGAGAEVTIGVLCLETSYAKIPGHIRNERTFGFGVRYQVVPGATPERLVSRADPLLLEPFIAAARTLEAAGVAAITSGCGFLALFQRELAAAVRVPLYASSLIQLPMVHQMVGPGRPVGLLAASAAALTPRHLAAIGGAGIGVCVAGMADQPEFREVILTGQRADLDPGRLEQEVLSQVRMLLRDHPDLGAIIIECTDLVPFAAAIQACAAVPVFDIVTLTEMVYRSLTR